jgi:hypothetical protein
VELAPHEIVYVTTHANAFGVIARNRIQTRETDLSSGPEPDFRVSTCVTTQKSGLVQNVSTIVFTGLNLLGKFFDFVQVFGQFFGKLFCRFRATFKFSVETDQVSQRMRSKRFVGVVRKVRKVDSNVSDFFLRTIFVIGTFRAFVNFRTRTLGTISVGAVFG